jgi:hypothetical protein
MKEGFRMLAFFEMIGRGLKAVGKFIVGIFKGIFNFLGSIGHRSHEEREVERINRERMYSAAVQRAINHAGPQPVIINDGRVRNGFGPGPTPTVPNYGGCLPGPRPIQNPGYGPIPLSTEPDPYVYSVDFGNKNIIPVKAAPYGTVTIDPKWINPNNPNSRLFDMCEFKQDQLSNYTKIDLPDNFVPVKTRLGYMSKFDYRNQFTGYKYNFDISLMDTIILKKTIENDSVEYEKAIQDIEWDIHQGRVPSNAIDCFIRELNMRFQEVKDNRCKIFLPSQIAMISYNKYLNEYKRYNGESFYNFLKRIYEKCIAGDCPNPNYYGNTHTVINANYSLA